jgi:hypothetical protein
MVLDTGEMSLLGVVHLKPIDLNINFGT